MHCDTSYPVTCWSVWMLPRLTLCCKRILAALAESLLAARWRQDLPSLSLQAGSPPSSINLLIRLVLSFLTLILNMTVLCFTNKMMHLTKY